MEKSIVYLVREETGEPVEAELWDDISDEHLKLWRATWVPLVKDALHRLINDGVPETKWPQDLHWDWSEKSTRRRGLLAVQRFAITCENKLQGLMFINLTKQTGRIPTQVGKDLAYIEYVASAPWNRPELTRGQVFSGLGSNMIRTAIASSIAEGFRGRIALHSLEQSVGFYDRKCGMTNLGADASYDGLIYFEMTEEQAAEFCSDK